MNFFLNILLSLFKRNPSLTVVYVKDEESGGFTTYFKEFPSVISQGNNKHEAAVNLHEDFIAAIESLKIHNERPKQTPSIISRPAVC